MSLGVIDDMWFGWVTDFGLPGPDRGAGGTYLLLPPGYTGELPDGGFIVARVRTTRAILLGRAFLDNDDPGPAAGLIKKTLKIYPYQPGGYGTSIGAALAGTSSLRRTPEGHLDWSFLQPHPAATFIEGSGLVMDTIPPNDSSYYELINELVQQEPAGALDPEIMGSLAAIGILKGKPFDPDARMRKILTEAAAIATATTRTLNWRARESEGFAYYPGSARVNYLFVGGYTFQTPPAQVSPDGVVTPCSPVGYRALHPRAAMFFYATGITPAMIMRLTEIGSEYLGAFTDSAGGYLDILWIPARQRLSRREVREPGRRYRGLGGRRRPAEPYIEPICAPLSPVHRPGTCPNSAIGSALSRANCARAISHPNPSSGTLAR